MLSWKYGSCPYIGNGRCEYWTDRRCDYKGIDFRIYTTYAKFHSVPLSSSTESPLVILNRKPPVSSPTESKALRIGDPSLSVIPHLMRDPALSGFPLAREWHTPCYPALDAGSSPVWIPSLRRSLSRAKPRDSGHACAGMTGGKRMAIDESRILNLTCIILFWIL